MRALGFPCTSRSAERVHDRPPQPNQLAARRLLRRYSRHGLRRRCKHGRCYLENADGSASAGAYHRHARVIWLHDGRLYVPVTSLEEPEAGQGNYACCTFRGFVTALDAGTGREVWKTYTIPETAKVVGKNSLGKDMLAPAGAGVWVTPTLDVKRRALYVATGNAFSGTPAGANAVMAFNMDTGKVLWTMQALALDVWHNGCVQNVPGRGGGRGRGAAPQGTPAAAHDPVGRRPRLEPKKRPALIDESISRESERRVHHDPAQLIDDTRAHARKRVAQPAERQAAPPRVRQLDANQ